jgi:hypothetical protein
MIAICTGLDNFEESKAPTLKITDFIAHNLVALLVDHV